jgi:16S rRNA (cytosine967-C5)-methyltransferase
LPSPHVSPSRTLALEALDRVRAGQFAETALSTILQRDNPAPRDRALATELVYGVLRWRDRLDSIIAKCLARPDKKPDPRLWEILRIAAYQVFFLDRIPDHAAVDQAVTQARMRSGKHAGSFVNAVLRKALRESAVLDPPPGDEPDRLAVYYSHPEWLVRRWVDDFGPHRAATILKHNNSHGALELRVNRLKADVAEVVDQLGARNIEVRAVPGMPDALQVSGPVGSVNSFPGFKEGLFLVQGLASQMIAPLLNPMPGERILDACAAPGGKTAHIAALTADRAQIVALDVNPVRLRETAQNLERLGVHCVELIQGDAADPDLLGRLGAFDKILLDAPCANLGVLRHNPEAKYRIVPENLAKIAESQARLLQNAASALKRSGTLVYSVCSCAEEETRGLVDNFLTATPDYAMVPISPEEVLSEDFLDARGFFATFPPTLELALDGFFAARLRLI